MCTHRFKLSLLAAGFQLAALQQAVAAESDDSAGLEEVLVTGSYLIRDDMDMATGLGLTPQETPQSVSVMTSQRILDQQLDTITEVIQNAVGISTDDVDNVRHTYYARGFEVKNYQVDGVPLAWSLAGDSGETVADAVVYERVEFVRGATGLMTGAGEPSASINLVRKHADSTEFKGYIDAGVGRWSNSQVSADLASSLNSEGSVRGRVVAKVAQGDSYEDLYEKENAVFYGVLEADISADALLRVGANYQRNDPTSPTWGALPTWFSDGSRTDWSRSTTTAADWTKWRTTSENYFVNLTHSFANDWQLVANYNRLEYKQNTHLLYLYGDVDKVTGEGLASYPYRSEGDSTQDSFDLQLRGEYNLFKREHEFAIGALYSEQKADTTSYAALDYPAVGNFFEWTGAYPQPAWSDTGSTEVDLKTEQQGVYGATRLQFSDKLNIIIGARLSSWKRKGLNYGEALDYSDDNELIPYAGAVYEVTAQHRAYASYTEIFQPQSARDVNGGYLDPAIGESTELGLKSNFFDDSLQTSVALFQIKQDNFAQATGEIIPGTIEEAYRAVNGTKTEGFEFEAVGALSPSWQVSFGYTQFKAEDADGIDINTHHPRKLLKLFTSYQFPGALQGLTIGGGVNWQGEIYSNIVNPATGEDARLVQDDYALVSLMARYRFNEHLSTQLNVENAFDETYYSQVGFFDQYRYGMPMNYSWHLNYRF